jgi:hypothetical protein
MHGVVDEAAGDFDSGRGPAGLSYPGPFNLISHLRDARRLDKAGECKGIRAAPSRRGWLTVSHSHPFSMAYPCHIIRRLS